MYEAYILILAINIALLSIFVYSDIKSRSIEDRIVYSSVIFLLGLIAYFAFFFNALLVVLFSIFGIALFLFSKKTGNIGEGDVPIFLSTLLIIIISNNLFMLFYFLEIFISASFMLSFLIYKKTFSVRKRTISMALFSLLIILIFFDKIELSLLILLISSLYVLFSVYNKIGILYDESVEYLEKSEIIPGDLIINSLLRNSQIRIIKGKGRLTLIDKELLKKLDENEKYPIYHNSIPMTVPIFIAFLITIILLII